MCGFLSLESHRSAAAEGLCRAVRGWGERRKRKFVYPIIFLSPSCFSPQIPSLALHSLTFSSLWTPVIPTLGVILESARDYMNVAKKLMVSVVTNPTPAIVRSSVRSQVPHLQSVPVLSEWKRSTPCSQKTQACALTCVF